MYGTPQSGAPLRALRSRPGGGPDGGAARTAAAASRFAIASPTLSALADPATPGGGVESAVADDELAEGIELAKAVAAGASPRGADAAGRDGRTKTAVPAAATSASAAPPMSHGLGLTRGFLATLIATAVSTVFPGCPGWST